MNRHTDIQTDRQTDTQTGRHTGRQTHRQADTQTDTDTQTGRQTNRQADRHTDRQADRQTDSDFNTSAIRMRTDLKIENFLLRAKKTVKNLTSKKNEMTCETNQMQQLRFIDNPLAQYVSGTIMPIFRSARPYITAYGFQHCKR